MAIREAFPGIGSNYMDGRCDGWEYRTIFAGSNLQHSYDMVRQFLREEGYSDVPLPENADDLYLFRVPKNQKQYRLFSEAGFVHYPVKVLFLDDFRDKKTLVLCLYNENSEKALLRFHGLWKPDISDVITQDTTLKAAEPDAPYVPPVPDAEPLETMRLEELPAELQDSLKELKKSRTRK